MNHPAITLPFVVPPLAICTCYTPRCSLYVVAFTHGAHTLPLSKGWLDERQIVEVLTSMGNKMKKSDALELIRVVGRDPYNDKEPCCLQRIPSSHLAPAARQVDYHALVGAVHKMVPSEPPVDTQVEC
jgi:hypothetical protein